VLVTCLEKAWSWSSTPPSPIPVFFSPPPEPNVVSGFRIQQTSVSLLRRRPQHLKFPVRPPVWPFFGETPRAFQCYELGGFPAPLDPLPPSGTPLDEWSAIFPSFPKSRLWDREELPISDFLGETPAALIFFKSRIVTLGSEMDDTLPDFRRKPVP